MNLVLYFFLIILIVVPVLAAEQRFNISEGQSADEINLSYHRYIANSSLDPDRRDQFIGDSISMWRHYSIIWDDEGEADFTSEMFECFKEIIDNRTTSELVELARYCALVEENKYFEQYGLKGSELPNLPVFYLKPKYVAVEKKDPGLMDLDNLTQLKKVIENEAKPSCCGSDIAFDLGNGVSLNAVWIEELNGWVGQYEVTNAQYRCYDASHTSGQTTEYFRDYTLDEDTQPVVKVSYHQVIEYTEWLNRLNSDRLPEGYHFRLPMNNEWFIYSKCEDGREFPWGNSWPPSYGNYLDSGNYPDSEKRGSDSPIKGYTDKFKVTAPVKESGRNEFGLYGISGNVQEYTSEIIDDRVLLRGGYWGSDRKNVLRCEYSYPLRLDQGGITIGFRVVLMPNR